MKITKVLVLIAGFCIASPSFAKEDVPDTIEGTTKITAEQVGVFQGSCPIFHAAFSNSTSL
ncbi:MAG: hypothetical protein HOM11_11560 [Methylococcales bacterium]|jgi:hypothetical protein|nr:hypothetical protein [Methylococcales bacterium]MBT7445909.1 hypothetical protein [Methylococcales bacterium]